MSYKKHIILGSLIFTTIVYVKNRAVSPINFDQKDKTPYEKNDTSLYSISLLPRPGIPYQEVDTFQPKVP